MSADTLARARRVVERIRAAVPLAVMPTRVLYGDVRDIGFDRAPVADAVRDIRTAAPALLALAEAVGRLVGATPERAEWWRSPSTDGRMTCRYCLARERLEGGVTSGHYVFNHDDWCAVPAIDAAFAQLAALADDDGEVGA